MPTVSDYVIVSNPQTTLETGADIDVTFPFSLPNNVDTGRSAIATWLLDVDNPEDLRWTMTINNDTDPIFEFTHGVSRLGAFQEVFGGSILNAGDNEVTVRVLSGGGQLRISDFAIHFQVDI